MATPQVEGASKSIRTECQLRAQREFQRHLTEQLFAHDIGKVEFVRLAMGADMSVARINSALSKLKENY